MSTTFESDWENTRLKEQLDEAKKLLRLAKETAALYEQALIASWPDGAIGDAFDYWNSARKALNDSKAVDGLILCDAVPVAKLVKAEYGNFPQIQWKEGYFGEIGDSFHLPSKPRRTEK